MGESDSFLKNNGSREVGQKERMSGRSWKMYVDGKWVDADTGARLPLPNPVSEELYADVPDAGVSDMQRAIDAARASFDRGEWRNRTVDERASVLEALADGGVTEYPQTSMLIFDSFVKW